MNKGTVLHKFAPVVGAGTAVVAALALVTTSQAGAATPTDTPSGSATAFTPVDTVIDGVPVQGYLGKTVELYYSDSQVEPPFDEQWNDAWNACEVELGVDAGQLRSVKRTKVDHHTSGDGYFYIYFACSASETP